MAIGKVTISSIAKLDGWLWDTHVTGFGARRQTNGTFYYVRYRHNGTQTVKSIGRHGPLTPDTARAKAKQLLGTVAGGTDPFAQALSGEGFPAAIDRYLERKRTSLKPNSFRETVRYALPSPCADRPAQSRSPPWRHRDWFWRSHPQPCPQCSLCLLLLVHSGRAN